ncbi:MAG: amino acid ABC transporter permease [Alphaproteobacteria bacterium]|nr:amino acid ABC transporter permease [Alphaproteobacteria bacterium]
MSWRLFEVLCEAAATTVLVSVASIALGLFLGLCICAFLLHSSPALQRIGRTYVSFFRGAPLLVQLLLLYNLLPEVNIDLPSAATAVLGLTLCTAAYQAENLRAGFAAVPRGLIEAAEVTGFTPRQAFLRIRVPIAVKLTLPAIANESIMILKASSLTSVVGMVELTETAKNLAASTFRPLEMYAGAGLLYLVLCWALAGVGRFGERLLAWERR